MAAWTRWARWPLGPGTSILIYLDGEAPTQATIDRLIAHLMLVRDCCPATPQKEGE